MFVGYREIELENLVYIPCPAMMNDAPKES